MLRIAFAAVSEANADAAPPEPRYCVLTESTVRARWIHVHRVGSNSRLREAVLDRSGQPLRLPVETDERTFLEIARAELANEAGRFAFVARDHRGRYQGRRDFWLYRSEAERAQILKRRTPTPAEKQEAALAAAVQRCESAEQALDVERRRREEVEVAIDAERTRGEQLARELAEALAGLADARSRIEEMADALVDAEQIMGAWLDPGEAAEGEEYDDAVHEEEAAEETSAAPGFDERIEEYAALLESLLGRLGGLVKAVASPRVEQRSASS